MPKPVVAFPKAGSKNQEQVMVIQDSFNRRKDEQMFQKPMDSAFKPGAGRPMGPGPGPARPFLFPLIQAQSINIIIIFLMELLLLRTRKEEIENENNLLRVANLEAKNSQLKQQLHPHFLFNSLNTLKSLIKRSPDEAEEYLLKLSGLLRYSTDSVTKVLVPLREELELCADYLALQQVRFGDSLRFRINIPEEIMNKKVPVYSIQLLAENAIKHNITTNSQPLYIEIKGDIQQNTVTVVNNLQLKGNTGDNPGLGLSNLSERYKLMGIDGVAIEKSATNFSVTIKVINDESGSN